MFSILFLIFSVSSEIFALKLLFSFVICSRILQVSSTKIFLISSFEIEISVNINLPTSFIYFCTFSTLPEILFFIISFPLITLLIR